MEVSWQDFGEKGRGFCGLIFGVLVAVCWWFGGENEDLVG